MHRIVFTARASADLERLHDFIAGKSPRAAQRAVQRLIEGLDLLALFPHSGVLLKRNIRTLTVRFGRSGYVVRYKIEADAVIITRIWHGREKRPR